MNERQNILDSERIYIPWLVDLAYLDQHVLNQDSFKFAFTHEIRFADNSDAYRDSIPYPELVMNLIVTASFLEKGLKYLMLVSNSKERYENLLVYKHDSQKVLKAVTNNLPDFEKSLRAKSRILFRKLIKVDYTNLRYLHKVETISISRKALKMLVEDFRDFIGTYRRDNIYSKTELHTLIQERPNIIRTSWPVIRSPYPSLHRQKIDQEFHQLIDSKEVKESKKRLTLEEFNFIKDCYVLDGEHYKLRLKIGIRASVRLVRLFRRIGYSLANWETPTLFINKGE